MNVCCLIYWKRVIKERQVDVIGNACITEIFTVNNVYPHIGAPKGFLKHVELNLRCEKCILVRWLIQKNRNEGNVSSPS